MKTIYFYWKTSTNMGTTLRYIRVFTLSMHRCVHHVLDAFLSDRLDILFLHRKPKTINNLHFTEHEWTMCFRKSTKNMLTTNVHATKHAITNNMWVNMCVFVKCKPQNEGVSLSKCLHMYTRMCEYVIALL